MTGEVSAQLRLALPLAAQQLGFQLMGTVDAALLGRYDGPQFVADPLDAVAAARNYVRRDGSWQWRTGENMLVNKIQSLIPAARKAAAAAGAPKAKEKA